MPPPVEVGEAFVLFLVVVGYVPVLRAYVAKRAAAWLVAGYTAILIGRAASLAEAFYWPAVLNLVEHAVGITLAACLFFVHFYTEWRTGGGSTRIDRTPANGDG